MTATTPPPQAEHSISENLEVIRNWLKNVDQNQRPALMSNVRTIIFVCSPIIVIGFLIYVLASAAQTGAENCLCADGGLRKGVSKQRLAAA